MNYEKSLEEAEACLKIKPDYSHGHLRKGRALLRLDKFDEAIQELKKALELEPKNQKFKEW
jgi:stress-induced-phosphoprotein 1